MRDVVTLCPVAENGPAFAQLFNQLVQDGVLLAPRWEYAREGEDGWGATLFLRLSPAARARFLSGAHCGGALALSYCAEYSARGEPARSRRAAQRSAVARLAYLLPQLSQRFGARLLLGGRRVAVLGAEGAAHLCV
jgi:hypothetical protein